MVARSSPSDPSRPQFAPPRLGTPRFLRWNDEPKAYTANQNHIPQSISTQGEINPKTTNPNNPWIPNLQDEELEEFNNMSESEADSYKEKILNKCD